MAIDASKLPPDGPDILRVTFSTLTAVAVGAAVVVFRRFRERIGRWHLGQLAIVWIAGATVELVLVNALRGDIISPLLQPFARGSSEGSPVDLAVAFGFKPEPVVPRIALPLAVWSVFIPTAVLVVSWLWFEQRSRRDVTGA